jgi:hypothetical protein
MKGLIRVVGSPLFLDTFTALGANPTQMLCRRATCAGHRRGGRQENDVDLHRRLPAQLEAHDVGLRQRPVLILSNKDRCPGPEADRAIVRQAAIDAGKQEVVIARKACLKPTVRCSGSLCLG